MPVLTIPLLFQPTSNEPKLYKFIKGSYGPNSNIDFTFKNTEDDESNIILNSDDVIRMILHDFKGTLVFDEVLIIADNGSKATYTPTSNDFIFNDVQFLKVWRLVDGEDSNDVTEEVLFEIV